MQEKTKLASPHIISICRSLFQFCYIIFTTKWGWVNCKTKLKTGLKRFQGDWIRFENQGKS